MIVSAREHRGGLDLSGNLLRKSRATRTFKDTKKAAAETTPRLGCDRVGTENMPTSKDSLMKWVRVKADDIILLLI